MMDSQYWLDRAVQVIWQDYKVNVEPKNKLLLKFGQNESVGTSYETVWLRGGDETFATTNSIDKVSSSNNGDNATIVIEGHTIDSAGDFTFAVQEVTLTGQTPATLATPLARMTRFYVSGSASLVGTIYGFENDTVSSGVPQTESKIHLLAEGANNQSQKASTTISKSDFWLIYGVYASVDEKTSASVDFDFQRRLKGKVFRTFLPGNASSNGAAFNPDLGAPIIIPANSDFRVRAKASSADTSVQAWASGELLRVI